MRLVVTYEIVAEADVDVEAGTVDLSYDTSDLPDRLIEAAWEEYERIKDRDESLAFDKWHARRKGEL